MSDQPLPPKGLIFDLDDTLIQTSTASFNTWNTLHKAFAEELDVPVSDLKNALDAARKSLFGDAASHHIWRHRMAESPAEILRRAADALSVVLPASTPDRFASQYVRYFFKNLYLFSDALDVLGTLKAAGMRLGMITNGEAGWQRRKLAQFSLEQHFDVILIEGEFGVGKPDPSTYQHVLDALSLPAHEVAMIGDRLDWDVLAPQSLGIAGIWYNYLHNDFPEDAAGQPDRIVRSLEELLR